MKHINIYIIEKLRISNKKTEHTLFPKTKDELVQMIKTEIRTNGVNCNLNHIDTSKIEDMSFLFLDSDFNGDISQWDVSCCRNMMGMFKYSKFTGENGDISEWDVSNVRNMRGMFGLCPFNQDISRWQLNPACNIEKMFLNNTAMEDRNKPILP